MSGDVAPATDTREAASELDEQSLIEVHAQLDVPGETGRQTRVFVLWAFCLLTAIVLSSFVGAHVDLRDEGSLKAETELARSRWAKARVALVFGLLVPAVLTFALNRRYRRGGGHARGITVDVTAAGELRIWGRGYGTRVTLDGAELGERFVDVYAGRLGAWRQRRLRVRGGSTVELATLGLERDLADGLRVEGGEGDCVELDRADFDAVRALVVERIGRSPDAPPAAPHAPLGSIASASASVGSGSTA